ncbi:MAG: DUF4350 domain-containing protein [Chloroflexota bacterium]
MTPRRTLLLSRDTWLALGLILLLSLVTAAAAVQQIQQQKPPPLASFSNTPDGGRALRLWLETLGYTTLAETGDTFDLSEEVALAWLLEPSTTVTAAEWESLDQWIESGGTLILAGVNWEARPAFEHFNFSLVYELDPRGQLLPQTPLLASPVIPGAVNVQSPTFLQSERSDFVVHLASASGPVLVSFAQGEGRVILGALNYPFSNAGLKEPGNPELALNLAAAAARPGQVLFDEWHHGVRPTQRQIIGPGDWLRYTPAGRSILFLALVIFLALLLQGQAFGRPVPLLQETARRPPLEYITALANLSRRAGHRQAVLRQFYQQLKRSLGRRYRISPGLPDETYVAELSLVRPGLDAAALLSLLERLRRGQASEKEMVQLAREASAWIKET